MKYTLRVFPDPVLLNEARSVSEFNDPKLDKIASKMLDIMVSSNGVGIAANQIGVPYKIAIIKLGGNIATIINPYIVSAKGAKLSREGCLSLPGKTYSVIRPTTLEISFQKLDGTPSGALITNPVEAAIASHEIDHLNGILISDYCNHYFCACNYAKNRNGSIQITAERTLSSLREKLGQKK